MLRYNWNHLGIFVIFLHRHIFGSIFLHSKVRKWRQNSVNAKSMKFIHIYHNFGLQMNALNVRRIQDLYFTRKSNALQGWIADAMLGCQPARPAFSLPNFTYMTWKSRVGWIADAMLACQRPCPTFSSKAAPQQAPYYTMQSDFSRNNVAPIKQNFSAPYF